MNRPTYLDVINDDDLKIQQVAPKGLQLSALHMLILTINDLLL